MMPPTFSVLLAWSNRPELARTLVENHARYGHHAPEIVIANGGGDFRALCDLVKRSGVPHVRAVDLPGIAFNKSLCLNVAAHVCRGTHVLLFDADMVATFDILGDALEPLQRGGTFVTARMIVESDPARGDANLPELAFAREVLDEHTFTTHDGRRATLRVRKCQSTKFGDNVMLMRRDDYIACGGLNSQLKGWGYEDTDFQLRVQFALGLERIEQGEVMHLTHHSPARSPHSFHRNMLLCFKNYERGDYTGSFERDRQTWSHARIESFDQLVDQAAVT